MENDPTLLLAPFTHQTIYKKKKILNLIIESTILNQYKKKKTTLSDSEKFKQQHQT